MDSKSIVAISTPLACGGIAVVRISGADSLDIAKRIFKSTVLEFTPRFMYFGRIQTESITDEGMLVYFKSPSSYTGEDMCEIHCHGNVLIATKIVEYAVKLGARLAENGEFTKRAFYNGKMDLSEAEGVIDLINADSVAEINSSFYSKQGYIYNSISSLQKIIIDMLAELEVAIDYPEEGIEEQTAAQTREKISDCIVKVKKLLDSYNNGRLIREGVKITVVGEPNVGKSKLLNAMIGYDRAIVTDIVGTTRDTLEESYTYNGRKFVITDTAGIRNTADKIENMGIDRSIRALNECDIVVAVTTPNEKFKIQLPNKPIIHITNKCDLAGDGVGGLAVSASTGYNIEKLKQQIFDISCSGVSANGVIISNIRHFNALTECLKALETALNNLGKITLDCITIDLNAAYVELGKITGVTASDDVIAAIFARFCVGK